MVNRFSNLFCASLSSLNQFLSLWFFLFRGVLKATVLDGIPDMPGLVDMSVYDTNLVHFISMCCNTIKWIQEIIQE